VQNVYAFKAQQAPDYILRTDDNGHAIIDPNTATPNTSYELERLESSTGTVLPSFGIIIEI
jgi:hypothetical protein